MELINNSDITEGLVNYHRKLQGAKKGKNMTMNSLTLKAGETETLREEIEINWGEKYGIIRLPNLVFEGV